MYEELQELARAKCSDIENIISLCAYNLESQELESWINDQLQVAISEDYGRDYEHLLVRFT